MAARRWMLAANSLRRGGVGAPQISALRLTAAASNENDQAGIKMVFHQTHEVVPVAVHNKKHLVIGIAQSIKIAGRHGQNVTQFCDFVPLTTQHTRHLRRHIVVEEKPHDLSGPLIWRATNVSISPRWSS